MGTQLIAVCAVFARMLRLQRSVCSCDLGGSVSSVVELLCARCSAGCACSDLFVVFVFVCSVLCFGSSELCSCYNVTNVMSNLYPPQLYRCPF